MIGVRPVRAVTSARKLCVHVTSRLVLRPPVASRSSVGGRSPGSCARPAMEMKRSACAFAEPIDGRAKWYAPWIRPTARVPAQSPAKYGLVYDVPSVALTKTNVLPADFTADQLIEVPCW